MENTIPSNLLGNLNFQTKLFELGFENIGGGWYKNKLGNIRIRLWKNYEVDFWLWRNSGDTDDNEIYFRGKIFSIDDVEWVLDHCFNFKK